MSILDAAAARARIAELDGEIRAWVRLDPDAAEAPGTGPLAGWPVGVKDLIDVRGLPTGAGAHDGTTGPVASADAPAVARLRAAGAAILGKTAAVEYGWFGTVTTRNPHNLHRSPGGSSSGSAAAVAAGMCRAALGTQTAGSVIRPAAYCGVPAIKFSHGVLDLDGVVATSPSLDSLGAFAADLADLRAVAELLLGEDAPTPQVTPRVGIVTGVAAVEPAVRERVDRELERLSAAGVLLETVRPDVDWTMLAQAHRTIMIREVAEVHGARHEREPGHYSPALGAAIAAGRLVSDADYDAALKVRLLAAHVFAAGLADCDAWLTAATTSYAPPAGEPGDPATNVPFTLAGLPAVATPLPAVPGEMPAALQFVGTHGGDLALLQTATAVQTTELLA